jgi:pyridoxamine 5'-phosphate oxidase
LTVAEGGGEWLSTARVLPYARLVELREPEIDPDPLEQLQRWLEESPEERIALATATKEGAPSVRMVLLKGADARGLAFYTSYESRKGRELEENPRGALLLYWPDLGRQVRVEGAVERVPAEESDAYWATRPPGSRVGAAASPQSAVIPDRDALEELVADVRARHGDDPPRPASWGGLRLVPETYEFWQHRDDRLHDRLRYQRDAGSWLVERLAP